MLQLRRDPDYADETISGEQCITCSCILPGALLYGSLWWCTLTCSGTDTGTHTDLVVLLVIPTERYTTVILTEYLAHDIIELAVVDTTDTYYSLCLYVAVRLQHRHTYDFLYVEDALWLKDVELLIFILQRPIQHCPVPRW